ncbi:ATP synthase F0 subunit 8 (mitochondrion) [Varroa destructor]|nr:ATP synthase F0 subunit 8 [Varroa destructor]WOZ03936.1 ATP synthase F0 subunit 8 [Varroa destructor]WOZ03938.1 ATP synthase F0 subunit 8 [Varroa destructor]WOZ03940.1 ATP synthase F0 subunit 8 [Varroa destructor]WOZ03942.1 ATP synthase F0 subunit 8 [Varroa destructor]WOZ03944.1 ATP synthase F0 subunit 8 [Varroa destructor]
MPQMYPSYWVLIHMVFMLNYYMMMIYYYFMFK